MKAYQNSQEILHVEVARYKQEAASLRLLVADYRALLVEAVDLIEYFSGSDGYDEKVDGFLERVQEWL